MAIVGVCLSCNHLYLNFSLWSDVWIGNCFQELYSSSRECRSKWVGLQYFIRFLNSPMSWQIIEYLILSFLSIVSDLSISNRSCTAPKSHVGTKRGKTSSDYHLCSHTFLSSYVWMLFLFSLTIPGVINVIIRKMGQESIYFMGEEKWFRHLFVFSHGGSKLVTMQ